MRFFGGKGGVGKTTLAAAFGLRMANAGQRTLVVSTDPAHSLGDVFDTPLDGQPRQLADRLWAAEISGEQQASARVAEIIADAQDAVPPEILPAVRTHLNRATESPGTVESALLDRLNDFVEQVGEHWDRLIVDSAPTGHMTRLLSLPTLLTPWIEGLASQRARTRAADERVAGLFGSAREEPDPLLDRLRARRARLTELAKVFREAAVVHLVLVPERLPLAETLRTLTSLRDSGLVLGELIVNRVLPADDPGLLGSRRAQQDEVFAELASTAAAPATVRVPMLPGTLTGSTELGQLAGHLAALPD
ncbi:ArsA family ATPase [Tamaricihabitans halophyticus]|uniref:ArsA family ATPase n=1 Tax=Tamaricihabitans halophyticus TaxID=1262583 RepID=UPI001FB32F3B|nr:ArsA family ATPase [Tamaricihabitans halophyticus]